jgi:hypothetical protein
VVGVLMGDNGLVVADHALGLLGRAAGQVASSSSQGSLASSPIWMTGLMSRGSSKAPMAKSTEAQSPSNVS